MIANATHRHPADRDAAGRPVATRLQGGPHPLRVLQIIPTLTVGGAERVVALLVRNLRQLGHTVGVISMYDPFGTWIEDEIRSEGCPLYFLGKRPGFDGRMIARIARVLFGFRPDVVHTHMYVLKYALPALASRRGCRFVHTIHNLAEYEAHGLDRIVQSLAFRTGVIPVAIGDAVAESMRRVYRLSPRYIIPNGIRVSDYAPVATATNEVRGSLGIPSGAPVFLSVGRFEPQKNTALAIRAFSSRRLRSLGSHLLLGGDGPLRRDLEQLARDLGNSDRVHFLGVRRDIPRVLAAADVFVLSSRYEGNPLSVMEAMAAGKPILASDVGCVRELVPAHAGRLIPAGDADAFEAAMYEFASDLRVARGAGDAAARIAQERFDSSVMARAYEELYMEI